MSSKRTRNLPQAQKSPPKPAEQPGEQRTVVAHQQTIKRYSGPIPAPEALEHYNRIVPGAADRIIRMAELEQQSRLDNSRLDVTERIKFFRRGQWMAFSLALTALGIGTALSFEGMLTLAGILFGTVVLGLATAFLGAKMSKPKDESPKGQVEQKKGD